MIKAPVVKFDGVTKYYRVGGRCVAALEDGSQWRGQDDGDTPHAGPNQAIEGPHLQNFSFSDVAYILQGAHPDDFLTLYENMVVVLRLHGLSKSASELAARKLIG